VRWRSAGSRLIALIAEESVSPDSAMPDSRFDQRRQAGSNRHQARQRCFPAYPAKALRSRLRTGNRRQCVLETHARRAQRWDVVRSKRCHRLLGLCGCADRQAFLDRNRRATLLRKPDKIPSKNNAACFGEALRPPCSSPACHRFPRRASPRESKQLFHTATAFPPSEESGFSRPHIYPRATQQHVS